MILYTEKESSIMVLQQRLETKLGLGLKSPGPNYLLGNPETNYLASLGPHI